MRRSFLIAPVLALLLTMAVPAAGAAKGTLVVGSDREECP